MSADTSMSQDITNYYHIAIYTVCTCVCMCVCMCVCVPVCVCVCYLIVMQPAE